MTAIRRASVGAIVLLLLLLGAALAEERTRRLDLGDPRHIELVFVEGLRLIEAGEARKAVVLFRSILARNPDLPRVRLELARAYFLMQSWQEAREEFVAVLSGDVPAPVKQNILRFIRAIDARRGFDWNAAIGVSLGPESGRDYDTDTVLLDFFGVTLPFTVERPETDAVGLSFDGSAEFRRELGGVGGASLVGFAGGSASLFDARGAASDDHSFELSAGARAVWPQTTAFAAAFGAVRHKGGDIHDDRIGLRAGAELRTVAGYSPFVTLSYARVNVHDFDPQDGNLYAASLGLSKSVFGAASIGAAVAAERLEARRDHESYDAVSLTLFGRADIGYGVTATARASARGEFYAETAPLFLDKRTDRRVSADVELTKADLFLLGGFSPFVSFGVTRNESTVDIYSYDEFRFRVGVKNAF